MVSVVGAVLVFVGLMVSGESRCWRATTSQRQKVCVMLFDVIWCRLVFRVGDVIPPLFVLVVSSLVVCIEKLLVYALPISPSTAAVVIVFHKPRYSSRGGRVGTSSPPIPLIVVTITTALIITTTIISITLHCILIVITKHCCHQHDPELRDRQRSSSLSFPTFSPSSSSSSSSPWTATLPS